MTTAHFALAAGSKPSAKTVPLWALMVATYLLDILFMGLVSFGVESFAPMNPAHPAYGQVIIHAYYTHSLVGALIIAAAAGLVGARFWGRNGGLAIGTVAFSHWILDLVVHRGDLPLLPGNLGHLPMLGFGLWNHPAVSIALEIALVVAGSILYYRGVMRLSGSERGARARAVTASGVTALLLVLLLLSDALALPMTFGMTLMLLLVALSGWLDGRIALTPAAAAQRKVRAASAAARSSGAIVRKPRVGRGAQSRSSVGRLES